MECKLAGCNPKTNEYCIPFQDDAEFSIILTAGYILLTAIVLPMGCMNLDDNITIQIISFVMLVVLTGIFILNYITIGLNYDAVPMIGSNFSEALGTAIFNYALIVFLPSWVNEKKPDVSINKTLFYSLRKLVPKEKKALRGVACLAQPPAGEGEGGGWGGDEVEAVPKTDTPSPGVSLNTRFRSCLVSCVLSIHWVAFFCHDLGSKGPPTLVACFRGSLCWDHPPWSRVFVGHQDASPLKHSRLITCLCREEEACLQRARSSQLVAKGTR
jgi:hypothetical protein